MSGNENLSWETVKSWVRELAKNFTKKKREQFERQLNGMTGGANNLTVDFILELSTHAIECEEEELENNFKRYLFDILTPAVALQKLVEIGDNGERSKAALIEYINNHKSEVHKLPQFKELPIELLRNLPIGSTAGDNFHGRAGPIEFKCASGSINSPAGEQIDQEEAAVGPTLTFGQNQNFETTYTSEPDKSPVQQSSSTMASSSSFVQSQQLPPQQYQQPGYPLPTVSTVAGNSPIATRPPLVGSDFCMIGKQAEQKFPYGQLGQPTIVSSRPQVSGSTGHQATIVNSQNASQVQGQQQQAPNTHQKLDLSNLRMRQGIISLGQSKLTTNQISMNKSQPENSHDSSGAQPNELEHVILTADQAQVNAKAGVYYNTHITPIGGASEQTLYFIGPNGEVEQISNLLFAQRAPVKFQQLFGSGGPVFQINSDEDPDLAQVLVILIRYFKTDQVEADLLDANAKQLLTVTNEYEIIGLKDQCEQFFITKLNQSKPPLETALLFRNLAQNTNAQRLLAEVDNYLKSFSSQTTNNKFW